MEKIDENVRGKHREMLKEAIEKNRDERLVETNLGETYSYILDIIDNINYLEMRKEFEEEAHRIGMSLKEYVMSLLAMYL